MGKAKKTNEIKKLLVSYTQATKPSANTSEVLKIKEAFPALNAKKIDQVNNIIKGNPKPKLRIQTTTKSLSRKQVIIPMSSDNNSTFMKNSSLHIANINRNLKNAKLEVLVNYICSDPLGITIITNKVSQQSDLQIINQYVKNSNDINALQVEEPRLPQSKSYLKIIGIPFFPHGNAQDRLTSSEVELILKQNKIFNNITLVSRPRVTKVSPKSDMAIIWIDIWDAQSSSNAKMLINRCFNVGKYIATIHSTNMNPGIPQCKNCWKWAMQPSHAEFKVPNASNVMALTSLRTTTNLGGAVRLMRRQIYHALKQRRVNPTLTPSSAPIVGVTIKQISTNVPSGDTTSTENGSRRSILRSMKTESNLFALQKAA